jgi:hypothetical protein
MSTDDERKREKDRLFQEEALRWLPEVTRFAPSLTGNEADGDAVHEVEVFVLPSANVGTDDAPPVEASSTTSWWRDPELLRPLVS